MPSSSSKPHPRQLELRWTGKGTLTQLSQRWLSEALKDPNGLYWSPHHLVSDIYHQHNFFCQDVNNTASRKIPLSFTCTCLR